MNPTTDKAFMAAVELFEAAAATEDRFVGAHRFMVAQAAFEAHEPTGELMIRLTAARIKACEAAILRNVQSLAKDMAEIALSGRA